MLPRATDSLSIILEINVGIQAISFTDGAFGMIVITAVTTTSLMRSPAMALDHFPAPPWGIIMLIQKTGNNKKMHFSERGGIIGSTDLWN